MLRQTVPEIHGALHEEYGLPISERNVDYSIQTWQELATASVLRDRRRIDALTQQGGIILAIDGLQPEKGHETLYLFRDTISHTNLLTQTLSNSSSDHLAALIDQVKAMGMPILGVVTDKQHSLVLAIDKALPGIPHQLCQFHFFRNLAQPVVEADRAMKKHIKKKLRGIAPVERSLAKRKATGADGGTAQAEAYCMALRATLQDTGKPPLDLGGLKMVDRVQQIDRSLAKSQEKGGLPEFSRLRHVIAKALPPQELVDEIRRANTAIHRLATLLTPGAPRATDVMTAVAGWNDAPGGDAWGDLARAHVARPLPEDRPGLRRPPVPLLRPSVASAHQQ